jgi:predicted component of type VI protein secretion system
VSRKLLINDGTRDRELQLVGRLVVGRDPSCDISDDHSLLSRRHAEFVTTGTAVTVRDLGSRNGVFVNGHRAAERALEPGDVVQIGPLRARYVVDAAPVSIIPESVDDRTAMLRKPDVALAATLAPAAAPVPVPRMLGDTAVPHAPVDDDVTRMVPGPARVMADTDPGSVAPDEEVTRFTPGPAAPDFAAAVLRPISAAAPAPMPAPVPMPAPLPMPVPVERAAAAPVSVSADQGLSRFVLVRVLLVALISVGATVTWTTLAPGLPGLLAALLIGGGVAMMVAGIINGRINSRGERS